MTVCNQEQSLKNDTLSFDIFTNLVSFLSRIKRRFHSNRFSGHKKKLRYLYLNSTICYQQDNILAM